jgi:hypothetical protein
MQLLREKGKYQMLHQNTEKMLSDAEKALVKGLQLEEGSSREAPLTACSDSYTDSRGCNPTQAPSATCDFPS